MLKVGRGASAPPFIVMDVITAANARQAELPPGAPHVIRVEVGQPATGAPASIAPADKPRISATRDNASLLFMFIDLVILNITFFKLPDGKIRRPRRHGHIGQ